MKKILIANRGRNSVTHNANLQNHGNIYCLQYFQKQTETHHHVRFADEAVCVVGPCRIKRIVFKNRYHYKSLQGT